MAHPTRHPFVRGCQPPMTLNDLLQKSGIDPTTVLVMRHRPFEPELHKVLPWLAVERPDVFNAYQQVQNERAEKAMGTAAYVASFVGREGGKATFVGLYRIGSTMALTRKQFWAVPANIELRKFGMRGFRDEDPRQTVLWFDLTLTDFYAHWKGKLVVGWPPPERSWWRRAHRNEMPVLAVSERSVFDAEMPPWEEMSVSWDELAVLRRRGRPDSRSGGRSLHPRHLRCERLRGVRLRRLQPARPMDELFRSRAWWQRSAAGAQPEALPI